MQKLKYKLANLLINTGFRLVSNYATLVVFPTNEEALVEIHRRRLIKEWVEQHKEFTKHD